MSVTGSIWKVDFRLVNEVSMFVNFAGQLPVLSATI